MNLSTALLAALGVLLPAPAIDEVSAGEPVPELRFRTLLGGDGRTKLEEYRGSPVLFAWYSTVPAGMNAARDVMKLAETFADAGLVVILMEIKNNDATYMRALQMEKLPGARCLLLKNQTLPFAYDDATGPPPKVALVGVDGTLLFAGSYQKLRDVEKLLKKETKKRSEGWGEHPLARSARAAAFGAGALGAGRADLSVEDAEGAEVAAARAEIEARFASWKRSVGFLRDAGEYKRAQEAAAGLVAAALGDAEWSAEARELLAAFESAELQAALKEEGKLHKLLKPLRKKRPAKGQAKKFRRFAEQSGDDALAARARRIADAIDHALEEF